MKTVWAILGAILATMTGTAILGDLVSEEIRGRLDNLPRALIRLAVRRLPPDVREDLAQEWTAELHEILRGAEALPITRLYRGMRYASGFLRAAPSIGGDLSSITTTIRATGKAAHLRRHVDVESIVTGIVAMGALGAILGMIFGPAGTVLGAVLGAVLGPVEAYLVDVVASAFVSAAFRGSAGAR